MRVAILISLAAAVHLAACTQAPQQATPKNDDEKTFYALGAMVAENLGSFDLTEQELELVKAGLSDGVMKKSDMKPEDLQGFMPKLQELNMKRVEASAERTKKEGAEHADKAAGEAGAEKTASGLVYKAIKEGTGASPSATDMVRVHYVGKLVDGTEFDSSRERNEPAEFPLNGVIECWTEGLQKMKVGGTAQLVCPSDIAYGDQGRPGIPPGATLTFEVELLDIVQPGAAAPAP